MFYFSTENSIFDFRATFVKILGDFLPSLKVTPMACHLIKWVRFCFMLATYLEYFYVSHGL